MSITLFCPAQIGLKSLKKKWTIELLFAMHKRQHTYKELKDEILGISDKILSERLRELNKLDLIENVKYSDYNRKYSLTEKGVLINRVLYELSLFGLAILDTNSFNSTDLREQLANMFSLKIE